MAVAPRVVQHLQPMLSRLAPGVHENQTHLQMLEFMQSMHPCVRRSCWDRLPAGVIADKAHSFGLPPSL